MTLSEFKAWFDGFTENMDGTPNKKQWDRIQKRVKQITTDPAPLIVERYVRPHWDRVWCSTGTGDVFPKFPSTCSDYNMLGKADALQIGASVSPSNC